MNNNEKSLSGFRLEQTIQLMNEALLTLQKNNAEVEGRFTEGNESDTHKDNIRLGSAMALIGIAIRTATK